MVTNYIGGGLLHRRNMMAEQTDEGIVYEWDYTMGLPEDNGWTKYTRGTEATVTLESNGMRVIVADGNSEVHWAPPVETCTSGWAEFTVIPISTTNANALNMMGIQLQLSDGIKGFKIAFRKKDNNANYIQHRYVTTHNYNLGNFFDNRTMKPNAENYIKVGNNIDGNTIGSLPHYNENTGVLSPNEIYTKTGYNLSTGRYRWSYYNTYNAFGLCMTGECIFISAKFTILESEEL